MEIIQLSPFVTELLIAAGGLIIAFLLGLWIGALIWKKYKNLADEWSREYHEKLESYTNLREAHDTLNAQFTREHDQLGNLQAKLGKAVDEQSRLERQVSELQQQLRQAREHADELRESSRKAIADAQAEVERLKALEKSPEPVIVPQPIPEPTEVEESLPKVESVGVLARAEADRKRLAELENSIGRLKNQILLLMPFQGKFERALKELETLRREEAAARDRAAKAEAAAAESQNALREAGALARQAASRDEIDSLREELQALREENERLEGESRTLKLELKKPKEGPAGKKRKKADQEATNDPSGDKGKEATLKRVKKSAVGLDFDVLGKARKSDRDNLQAIKGIGPFTEAKLNAAGIYTFEQLTRINAKMEDALDEIIETFPGRIKREKWKKQAAALLKNQKKG